MASKRLPRFATSMASLNHHHFLSSTSRSSPELKFIHSTNHNPNPNPSFLKFRNSPFRSFAKLKKSDENSNPPRFPPAVSEKRSLAVATGELFIALTSFLLRPRKFKSNDSDLNSKEDGGDRIGAVVRDDVDPEVIWEQREEDVEAERERPRVSTPGFSFSAAGLLFPYHLGVAEFLIEKGYIRENTPLAGSSAGAIVCAVIASGESMKEALKATKMLAENCRVNGTAFRLGAVLRDILENFLPDDVHIRSNGRIRVAITEVLWRPRGLLIDQFDSRSDLINAVITSSFIPGYLAPRPVTMFRNRICIDGGLTLFMPPTAAAETVRVCAFPMNNLGLRGIGISPDCNPVNRATTRQLFNWALEPADDYVLDQLFEQGYEDAAVWAKMNPVEETVKDGFVTAV